MKKKLSSFPKSTVILGLGLSGLSCIRYLLEQGHDNIIVNDSRSEPPGIEELKNKYPQIPVVLGGFDQNLLEKANQIIISPGISLKHPLIIQQILRGIEVIGDIELFAREATAPILGITGSNGKTTVTTLVGKMVAASGYQVAVGGNIGEPALDLLHQPADFYVLELSSFQLETTNSLKLKSGVILNVTEDHMDRYQNFEEYCKAKQRIYYQCEFPIVYGNQPETWKGLNFQNPPVVFSLTSDADFCVSLHQGQSYLFHQGAPLIATNELLLHHPHHLENALAALALGSTINLPMEVMLNVLRSFSGLPHRCQLVRTFDEVAWYNDSKGTNVGATIAAILSLGSQKKGRLILIAGGDSKKADLQPLFKSVSQYVDKVILIGQDAPLFYNLLSNQVNCLRVESLADAVESAHQFANAGDIVLLSPACASFDMFNNYEHRGEVFMKCVNSL